MKTKNKKKLKNISISEFLSLYGFNLYIDMLSNNTQFIYMNLGRLLIVWCDGHKKAGQ